MTYRGVVKCELLHVFKVELYELKIDYHKYDVLCKPHDKTTKQKPIYRYMKEEENKRIPLQKIIKSQWKTAEESGRNKGIFKKTSENKQTKQQQ